MTSDPRVPADERYDANAELYKSCASQLEYPDQAEVIDGVQHLLVDDMLKARPLEGGFLIESQLTQTRTGLPAGHEREHVGILQVDEHGLIVKEGGRSRWIEKRQWGGFDFCKAAVASIDILKAIMLTRQRQIEDLLQPDVEEGPLGYRFIRRDREKMTDRDKARVAKIELFLANSGDEPKRTQRDRLQRCDMRTFAKKLIWDSLSGDACPIELVRRRDGKLSGYHNIPYDTVRLCTELGYEGDDAVRAVQIFQGLPQVAFGYDDILYPIRNPRSDLYAGGYGYAEPEMIIRAMTNYVSALEYNSAGLNRNATPRGILTLFGAYNQDQLRDFKTRMSAMLTGANKRWNLPILASETKDAGHIYTPIDQNFNEMMFARWTIFHVAIICAICGIDPAEVHFDSFTTRSSSLAGNDTAEKLASSRDKGLIPLVRFVQGVFDDLVGEIDPTYAFRFVGLYQDDANQKHELIKLTSTVDQIRERRCEEPMEDPILGNAPTNPALMQAYMLSLQQQQQAQAQPGEDGEGTGDDPIDFGGAPQGQEADGEDEDDYPRNATGAHDPYGSEKPPADEHLHTLSLEKARRRGDFMVVIER